MLMTQTLEKLDALGLSGMALGLREQLEGSQYLGLSFDERFGLLIDREAEVRDTRRLALRLKAARLLQEATVEDIDLRAPRGLDRSVIMSLAQAGWVAAHHNLLIHRADRRRQDVHCLRVDACSLSTWPHGALRSRAAAAGRTGAQSW
jgi:hypothetical protein